MVEVHLRLLKEEFKRCFLDLSSAAFSELKMTRNPFSLNKDILSEDLHEEFSQKKYNSIAKNNCEADVTD